VGLVQYQQACVCIRCHTRDRAAQHKLGKRGKVFTFTIDYLAPVAEHSLPMVVRPGRGWTLKAPGRRDAAGARRAPI
jgi:hypothetical protein